MSHWECRYDTYEIDECAGLCAADGCQEPARHKLVLVDREAAQPSTRVPQVVCDKHAVELICDVRDFPVFVRGQLCDRGVLPDDARPTALVRASRFPDEPRASRPFKDPFSDTTWPSR